MIGLKLPRLGRRSSGSEATTKKEAEVVTLPSRLVGHESSSVLDTPQPPLSAVTTDLDQLGAAGGTLTTSVPESVIEPQPMGSTGSQFKIRPGRLPSNHNRLQTEPEPKVASRGLTSPREGGRVEEEPECPPYREEIGRCTWTLLHSIAAYIPDGMSKSKQNQLKQFMHCLSVFYPCKECAKEFRAMLRADPPPTKTRAEFSQWLGRIHNNVNVRLGKPEYDCSRINERWKDGWKDGSCD